MTGALLVDSPDDPRRIQVDAWESAVMALPAVVLGSGSAAEAVSEVQERVDEALTIELASLRIGEGMRVVTAFGANKCEAAVYRTGVLPTAPSTQLSSVVGIGAWERATTPLPAIGGNLVVGVVPTDASGMPVPWSRFDSATGTDGTPTPGIWTRLVDRLTYSPHQVAVVVEVVRVDLPTLSQELLIRGLESRSRQRTEQRQRRRDNAPTGPAPSTGPNPVGDYVMSVGVVGDFAAIASAWRAETGYSIRRAIEVPMPAVSRQMVSLVTAPVAARWLPFPVLSAHSTVPVRRFRPRSTPVTQPLVDESAVVVARTDAGAAVGFDAESVNRNMLVVGDIGTGKSTTTMSMLADLWDNHGIPWLVIDPLKYEYARLRVALAPGDQRQTTPVRHLRLGETPINPLAVPDGVNPLAFASAMAQAFSSTSALGEAFPLGDQIARAAFNELYANRQATDHPPTFADLEAAMMAASHQDGMTGETANNIRTSLLGRIRAITSGAAGDVFAGGPRAGIDWHALSSFPTVITFPAGIGQQEKAVVYALLVASHWSWRLANPTSGRHLIVLEEVHQVYGRSNPMAAAVLDSLLATMRSSGQGYLAVTQTPHQLDEQTQRLFQNLVAHRIRHTEGLEMLHALGIASAEVQDLDDGEVIALFRETSGIRGRVTARTGDAGSSNPMLPLGSHRADEFAVPGPYIRGWCSACPRPCGGRTWLSLAPRAAEAADAALAGSADLRAAATAAVRATRAASALAAGAPIENKAGVYCASARGLTVAMGVRRATDAAARTAVAHVRNLVLDDSTSERHRRTETS